MDRHTLHEPLDMVDVVYNLASPPPGGSAEDYARFNGGALKNLLEEANEHGAKVFVLLSCLDVYGSAGPVEANLQPRPRDEYQRAKLDGAVSYTHLLLTSASARNILCSSPPDSTPKGRCASSVAPTPSSAA